MAGEPGGDGAGEAGGVDVAGRDVDGDRDVEALGAPAGDLGEGGLQDVLGEVGHQARGLGDGDELVRRHLAALGVDPADERLQTGDLAVEADLRLVVEFDLAGVEGAAEVTEEAEPVGRVGVALGLVDLDAGAVALGLVHGDVGPAQQALGVEGVVGEDGDAGAGLQDEGEPVEVERRGELGDEVAGDPLGAGGGVGRGQQDGELVAAEPGGLGAAGQGEAEPFGDLQEQPVSGEVPEGVVDGAEAVQVDQDEGGAGSLALGLLQGVPGPLQEPLAVGEPGERVAELFLGAGAGDPEGGVEGDEGDGEERQEDRPGGGDDADERGDAEEGDGDEALPEEGGAGDGGQSAALGCERVPQEEAGDHEVGARGEDDFREVPDRPVEGPPGLFDGRYVPEGGEHEGGGADPEDVGGAVLQALAPAVPAGGADEGDDGERDESRGHPAVQQEDGEGEGGAGAGAAPPAVPAEGDQVADDEAGEDGEGPAGDAAGEESVAGADGSLEPGDEHDGGDAHHGCGQPGGEARGDHTAVRPWDPGGALGRFHSRPSHRRRCRRCAMGRADAAVRRPARRPACGRRRAAAPGVTGPLS
ncbi:hypothetical protein STANM309S_02206 [Streptomyces tanashiensis]